MKRLKYIIGGVVLIIFIYILFDSLSQPGIADLKGNFQEIAFERNEQNTGPVLRVYSVSVQDTVWQEMEQYGNYMPFTKYGNTSVYFFKEGGPIPEQLELGDQPFDEQYQDNCLGKYEKDAMSQVSLIKFPFQGS